MEPPKNKDVWDTQMKPSFLWSLFFAKTFIFALVILIFLGMALFWPFVVGGLWAQLAQSSENLVVRMLALITLTSLAVGLYLFRRLNRFFYGLSEFLLGFVAAWKTLGIASSTQSEFATTLALAGCVYLMIRGIDNLVGGLDDWRDYLARTGRPL